MNQVSLETKPSNKVANDFKQITNYEKEKNILNFMEMGQKNTTKL